MSFLLFLIYRFCFRWLSHLMFLIKSLNFQSLWHEIHFFKYWSLILAVFLSILVFFFLNYKVIDLPLPFSQNCHCFVSVLNLLVFLSLFSKIHASMVLFFNVRHQIFVQQYKITLGILKLYLFFFRSHIKIVLQTYTLNGVCSPVILQHRHVQLLHVSTLCLSCICE